MLLLLSACAPDPVTGTTFASLNAELSALPIRDVVVVQCDTLRADRLPFYGGPRDTLPVAGAWQGWAVWEDAYSAAPWTFPSVASLLTGVDVAEHGLLVARSWMPGVTGAPMWQAGLGAAGVHAGYFNGNNAMQLTNLADGWERVETGADWPDDGVSLVASALRWVDGLPPGAPFFAMIQPMDTHAPWSPRPEHLGTWSDPASLPFRVTDGFSAQQAALQAAADAADAAQTAALRESMLAIYDEEILGLDAALASLAAGLWSRGRLDQTLIVLTADHGESFFEVPATFGHGYSVRQELIHIPLAIYHPSLRPQRLADCPVSNMDLLPLIGAWAGWPAPVPPLRGCREAAPASLYTLPDEQTVTLDGVSLAGASVRVEIDCTSGAVTAFDLRDDPAALTALPPEEVAGGAELLEALRDGVRDILARRPDVACAGF